ncbi:MAG: chemotaxis protein CheW [Planctomycetota bacterium]
MLAIQIHVGKDAYAIDVSDVLEVIPMVRLRSVPRAPAHVAGIFSYRGAVVPVVDVCRLIDRRECDRKWSTRIVLVRIAGANGEPDRILGLLAERVTELTRFDVQELQRVELGMGAAGYLGAVIADGRDMIQFLHVERILTEDVRQQLLVDEVAQA